MLGVEPWVNADELKEAYLERVKENHPDRPRGKLFSISKIRIVANVIQRMARNQWILILLPLRMIHYVRELSIRKQWVQEKGLIFRKI